MVGTDHLAGAGPLGRSRGHGAACRSPIEEGTRYGGTLVLAPEGEPAVPVAPADVKPARLPATDSSPEPRQDGAGES